MSSPEAATLPDGSGSSAPSLPPSSEVQPLCPVCGGYLMEIRARVQCVRCHTICETCCDGSSW
ncbi:MAG: hypothetical protein JO112_04505 [Planctomycetes bacterium]|nr:hypothetical protein [Planctomycetota bacterium]